MRLIDADEFIEYVNRRYDLCSDELRMMIENQPTAYNVDKVVAEIKVGDVVERMNFTELFVVSGFNEGIYTLINANGRCVCANVNQIKKTGKHVDIQSVLHQIGGVE